MVTALVLLAVWVVLNASIFGLVTIANRIGRRAEQAAAAASGSSRPQSVRVA